MCIKELSKLDRSNKGNGDAAMSLGMEPSSLSAEDRAVNALSHRMGAYVPPERR